MVPQKPVVIIVEDDASVRRALEFSLEAGGFEVLAFSRPKALLGIAIPDYNACLLLDIYLPEMTGVELYKSLKSSGCHLPAILITARVDSATRTLIEEAGPVPILIKPFSRKALLSAVGAACLSVSRP